VRNITLQYNAQGWLDRGTNPIGGTTVFEYDPSGRITKETRPDAEEVVYTYDAKGNPTSITPPGRPAHVLEYTPVDLLRSYRSPDAGAGAGLTLWAWDADRELTRTTRPEGGGIDRSYDAAGRLSSLTFSGGAVTYGYEAGTGRLGTITGPSGVDLAVAYDGPLLTARTWSGTVAGSVQDTYDNNFWAISQSVNGGSTVAFGYDNEGLLTSAGALVLTRDAQNGLVTGTTLSNVTETWGYNTFGESVSYAAVYQGTGLLGVQYVYDNLGRVVTKTETIEGVARTFGYTYDAVGRLRGVGVDGSTTTYSYDANGNRSSFTGPGGTVNATYDVRDRLLQYGATTYGYSASGERLWKANGGQTTTYTYDVLGNLIQVALPDGTQVAYVLDGLGRRLGKKVGGTVVQGWLYQDDLRPVAELDGAGVLVSRFVYGNRGNVPDYMVKGNATYRIIADHLGSPRLVVNTATGGVEQRMEYDEFGRVTFDDKPGFQPFGFAGGLYDQNTKLVRFGARDYDAEAGRWTTRDPLLFLGDQVNLYVYVGNDPVNLIDPTGLWGWCLWASPKGGIRLPHNLTRMLRAMDRTSRDPGLARGVRQSMEQAVKPAEQAAKAAAETVDKVGKAVQAFKPLVESWAKQYGETYAKGTARRTLPKDVVDALAKELPYLKGLAPPAVPAKEPAGQPGMFIERCEYCS
jgi:RHS repeat-associated protein